MAETDVTEAQIADLVRKFYGRARLDPVLGPLFDAAISDWEEHFSIVQDFWSHALLGTTRYRGRPFPPHIRLPIEPPYFERWLDHFKITAEECLPVSARARALAKARHMTESFRVGLFPFTRADGSISRTPG